VIAGATDTRARQFNKPISYAPDSLLNNEIGFKSEFLERRLLVNASIYQMDWKDVQTLILQPAGVRQHDLRTHRPDLPDQGRRAAARIQATEALTLAGNMSYNDSKQSTRVHSLIGVTPTTPAIRRRWVPASRRCARATITSSSRNARVRAVRPRHSRRSCSTNLRARYDWSVSDYNAFLTVGMSHVDDMANEPSSFQSA